MGTIRIEDLPEDIRPFEKYRKQGIAMLSDTELLALILRTGTKKLNCMELCSKVLELGSGSLAGLYGRLKKNSVKFRELVRLKRWRLFVFVNWQEELPEQDVLMMSL